MPDDQRLQAAPSNDQERYGQSWQQMPRDARKNGPPAGTPPPSKRPGAKLQVVAVRPGERRNQEGAVQREHRWMEKGHKDLPKISNQTGSIRAVRE